jgi:hypothetical protein
LKDRWAAWHENWNPNSASTLETGLRSIATPTEMPMSTVLDKKKLIKIVFIYALALVASIAASEGHSAKAASVSTKQ